MWKENASSVLCAIQMHFWISKLHKASLLIYKENNVRYLICRIVMFELWVYEIAFYLFSEFRNYLDICYILFQNYKPWLSWYFKVIITPHVGKPCFSSKSHDKTYNYTPCTKSLNLNEKFMITWHKRSKSMKYAPVSHFYGNLLNYINYYQGSSFRLTYLFTDLMFTEFYFIKTS